MRNAVLSNENNEIMSMSGFFFDDSKGFSLRFCMEWLVCAKYDLGGCV